MISRQTTPGLGRELLHKAYLGVANNEQKIVRTE
jgi:hypothetical protein